MKRNSSDFFQTSDIWVTAYLLSVGVKYIDVLRTVESGKRKVYFLFPLDAEPKAHDFFRGASVPAVSMRNSVENVKSILFDF